MTPRPVRSVRVRRRQVATFVGIATVMAGGIIGFACGFDGVGQLAPVQPAPDTSDTSTVNVEASPIPKADVFVAEDTGIDADPPAPTCPTGGGTMVMVDAGGLFFCIDSTEVTNGEYDKFLRATDGGAPAALDAAAPSGCAGNGTFRRAGGAAPDAATLPVARIDWCDAYSFCRWAGKRLCGKTVDGDASTGEWFAACTNGGLRTHPYGNGYEAGACNEDQTGVNVARTVASFPGCQGGVPGLFDMNGNVAELIDNCGPTTCTGAGGYYFEPQPGCAVVTENPRSMAIAEIGFRCCADPE